METEMEMEMELEQRERRSRWAVVLVRSEMAKIKPVITSQIVDL